MIPLLRDETTTAKPEGQDWLYRLRLLLALADVKRQGTSFQDVWRGSPWIFVAVLRSTVEAHWVNDLGRAPVADLELGETLVRFSHHALIFYTLACLKETSADIPDSWILTAFEAIIASINDDVTYTAKTVPCALDMVDNIHRKVKMVPVDFKPLVTFHPGEGLAVECFQFVNK